MTEDEKARLILEGMDEILQIDWNLEEFYLNAIKRGLKNVDIAEKENQKRSEKK